MISFDTDSYFDLILDDVKVMSRKQAYQRLLTEAGRHIKLDELTVLSRLMEKERQGDDISGIGNGVAIAHTQVPTLTRPFKILAKLGHLVDFDSIDEQPVDIVCVLLSPKADERPYHLRRLSRLSRLLRDVSFCKLVRGAKDPDSVRALLLESQKYMQAA